MYLPSLDQLGTDAPLTPASRRDVRAWEPHTMRSCAWYQAREGHPAVRATGAFTYARTSPLGDQAGSRETPEPGRPGAGCGKQGLPQLCGSGPDQVDAPGTAVHVRDVASQVSTCLPA